MNVDRIMFWTKMIVIPAAFFLSFGLILSGAFAVAMGKPMMKLAGLGFLLAGIGIAATSMWISLGRPSEWFAPGENTDYNPRR